MKSKKNRIFIIEADSLIYRLYRELFPERELFSVMPQLTGYEKLLTFNLSRDDIVIADISADSASAAELLTGLAERFPYTQVIAVAEKGREITELAEKYSFSVLKRPFRFGLLREQVDSCIKFTASRAYESITGGLDEFAYPLAGKVGRNPAGLRAELLNSIIELMQNASESYSAKEVAQLAMVSVSTARRYMEYLLKDGRLTVEYSYKRAGHPEKRYTISLL